MYSTQSNVRKSNFDHRVLLPGILIVINAHDSHQTQLDTVVNIDRPGVEPDGEILRIDVQAQILDALAVFETIGAEGFKSKGAVLHSQTRRLTTAEKRNTASTGKSRFHPEGRMGVLTSRQG